jgi:hypothetical protein
MLVASLHLIDWLNSQSPDPSVWFVLWLPNCREAMHCDYQTAERLCTVINKLQRGYAPSCVSLTDGLCRVGNHAAPGYVPWPLVCVCGKHPACLHGRSFCACCTRGSWCADTQNTYPLWTISSCFTDTKTYRAYRQKVCKWVVKIILIFWVNDSTGLAQLSRIFRK